ncbi:MAG TPA: YbhB/YbcL family Raf kinase inhibitor-like protein [Kofleriaceae bacterium]
MRLTSPAFHDGDEIPAKYTCEGIDVSPPLEWTDVPAQARSLALIVDDPDAPDPDEPTTAWVHWVLCDLPPSRKNLHENLGRLASGHVGVNDWRRAAWNGPSPPIGRHRYFFKLYALDRELALAHPTKLELERAMDGHVLAEATLIGTYKKHAH